MNYDDVTVASSLREVEVEACDSASQISCSDDSSDVEDKDLNIESILKSEEKSVNTAQKKEFLKAKKKAIKKSMKMLTCLLTPIIVIGGVFKAISSMF